MGTLFVEANADANVHLVNASINSLPCMLCPASSEKRFVKRRDLLASFRKIIIVNEI